MMPGLAPRYFASLSRSRNVSCTLANSSPLITATLASHRSLRGYPEIQDANFRESAVTLLLGLSPAARRARPAVTGRSPTYELGVHAAAWSGPTAATGRSPRGLSTSTSLIRLAGPVGTGRSPECPPPTTSLIRSAGP